MRALYCPKASPQLPILTKLWGFEFLEEELKICTQNRRKLDFSFLVSIFHHVVVVRYVPKLVFAELGNRPRWKNKLRYKTDHDNVVKNAPNLVEKISMASESRSISNRIAYPMETCTDSQAAPVQKTQRSDHTHLFDYEVVNLI